MEGLDAEIWRISGYEDLKQREGQMITAAGRSILKESLQRLVEFYQATRKPA